MDTELVAKIASKLFPAKTELTWDVRDVPPEERFWVVPGNGGLRWIIPQNQQYGWPVLRQWRPYDISSRLKWTAIITAYRTGRLGMMPRVVGVGVAGLSNSTWEHMGWQRDSPIVPVIYVGTPGPTRKAVITLVDRIQRKATSVLKMPIGSSAAKNILREADILRRLKVEKPGLAPSLFFEDRERGVAAQEMVEGRPTGRRLSIAHIEWLDGLRVPGEETSMLEQAERLALRLKGLTGIDEKTLFLLNGLLDGMKDPTPLPAVWVHGDFAPWNLRWVGGRILMAIDWEDARAAGLPLQDLFHFQYIQAYLFGTANNSQDVLLKNPMVAEYLSLMGINQQTYRRLALFYLIERWVSRIENNNNTHAIFLLSEIARVPENKK